MTAALTIVIPSHRRADLLTDCLNSVLAHAPPNSAVIVVDDGSERGEVTLAAKRFPGVTVIRHDKPHGFSRAANAGLNLASSPIVEVLNDDTVVSPDWATRAMEAFNDPGVGAAAPLVLQGPPNDNPRIDSAGDGFDRGGFAFKHGHGQPLTDEFLKPRFVFGASGSSAFYRRELIHSLGGFPESFESYFEDVDLSFRIHRAGFNVAYAPGSRVWHYVGQSHEPSATLVQRQSRNEERVFWRNLPWPTLLRTLPRHVAVLFGKALRRKREGTLWPWLKGRLSVVNDLPAILRHRRNLGPVKSPVSTWELQP